MSTFQHIIKNFKGKERIKEIKKKLQDMETDPAEDDNVLFKWAAKEGNIEIVELLLADDRVDPVATDNEAIKLAIKHNHADIVKLLLADRCADFANTSLLLAIEQENEVMVEAILKNSPRIDIDLKDSFGQSIFSYKKGNQKIISLLHDYKSSLELEITKKLQSALLTTKRTLILGSTNKIANFEKYDAAADALFVYQRDTMYDNLRILVSGNRSQNLYAILHENPLDTLPLFKNAPELNSLIATSLALKNAQVGNCHELSYFSCARLWENAGKEIRRIEVVKGEEFDHVWVIVNRKPGSDLLRPDSWGEAWILDPWWEDEGRYYPASEFHEKILETLNFYIQNYDELHKKTEDEGFEYNAKIALEVYSRYMKELTENKLKIPISSKIDIDTTLLPYPFLNDRSIEDYYTYVENYWDSRSGQPEKRDIQKERADHKALFAECVKEINSLQEYDYPKIVEMANIKNPEKLIVFFR